MSEDYEAVEKMILDPRGHVISQRNIIFMVACSVSLFVDQLFFYLPTAEKKICIAVSIPLQIVLRVIRTTDLFYFAQIFSLYILKRLVLFIVVKYD